MSLERKSDLRFSANYATLYTEAADKPSFSPYPAVTGVRVANGFLNQILGAVPLADLPPMQEVPLILRHVLHEQDASITDVFFVETGMVSITVDTFDGAQVEVYMVGPEGVVGIAALLNDSPISPYRSATQLQGTAYRISLPTLQTAFARSPIFRNLCLNYIELAIVQMAVGAACNARHSLTERLARWLLMMHDYVGRDDMPVTQELLSIMLGVRRSSVTTTINTLRTAGLISQSRGIVRVVNRNGLLANACGCYGIFASHRQRLSAIRGLVCNTNPPIVV